MADRLVWLLKRFELRASVFQAGHLACQARVPDNPAVGFMHILRSGRLRLVSEDGVDMELHEPTAFFYMNPTQHYIEPLDDEVSIICATFEFGIGEGNPLQVALPNLYVLPLAEAPTLDLALQQLFWEAEGDHCGRDALLDQLSGVVLILMLRDLMDQKRLDIGLLAGLADPKLMRAINAIHERPELNWTLDKMAGAALMSRARFAERFHEIVGMTPGAYLSDWRLGLAKSKLLRGRSVQSIAADVGYGSASALSRVFATRFGMSPTEWKRSAEPGSALTQ